MTNLDIVNEEISELERSKINYQVAEKLAWLYIIRDHLTEPTDTVNAPAVVVSRETPAQQEQTPIFDTDSEFINTAYGVNVSELLDVLNEHMDVLKVVYPKEYAALMQKIDSLH